MGEVIEMNKGVEAKANGTGPIDKPSLSDAPRKLSYDDLENVCKQLSEQNRKMYQQLENMQLEGMFKRLDYLFKVVENHTVFDESFLNLCVGEIVATIDMRDVGDSNSDASHELTPSDN